MAKLALDSSRRQGSGQERKTRQYPLTWKYICCAIAFTFEGLEEGRKSHFHAERLKNALQAIERRPADRGAFAGKADDDWRRSRHQLQGCQHGRAPHQPQDCIERQPQGLPGLMPARPGIAFLLHLSSFEYSIPLVAYHPSTLNRALGDWMRAGVKGSLELLCVPQ